MRAGILIGVAVTTVIAIVVEAIVRVGPSMGTNPRGWALSVPALPDSVLGVPDLSLVGAVSFGAFARLDIVTVVLLVLTLVLANFSVVGGAASSSSNTVFVESASGITEGARTGLANVVTGVLFLSAMFCTPLYAIVPIEAAAQALVVVGTLIMRQIVEIDFTEFRVALPAVMPFTYSIRTGSARGSSAGCCWPPPPDGRAPCTR